MKREIEIARANRDYKRNFCSLVRGVGFEPANPYGTAASGYRLHSNNVDWESFKRFVEREYRPITARSRLQYALKYHKLLLKEDFSVLHNFSAHKRVHILKALAVLSRYLGLYMSFKLLMKQYGFNWSTNDKDDVIIARMLKPLNSASVVDWMREVYAKVPEVKPYIDFMLFAGLRPLEGIDSFNLLIRLHNENRFGEYYAADQQMLQHFKYRSIFIRRSKKVYISFVPYAILQQIFNCKSIVRRTLYKHLEKNHFSARFCDIREYWATQMSRHLSRVEIDFLQGRVSGNVFMVNYFNPTYIEDLQSRTIKGARDLLLRMQSRKTKTNL